MQNVLFLCRTNGSLSLMAEAYMRTAGYGIWRAWSAGLEPKCAIDPVVRKFLKRAGLGRHRFYSKSWRAFAVRGAPSIDLAVVMEYGAEPLIQPDLPGRPQWITWSFDSIGDCDHPASSGQQPLLHSFAEVRRRIDPLLLADPGLQRRVA